MDIIKSEVVAYSLLRSTYIYKPNGYFGTS